MLADLKGSVNKIRLTEKKGVLSVYEAVVNSIQSNSKNIIVEIKKEKNPQLQLENQKDNIPEEIIKEIRIKDDGDGFTEENYNSFQKINSTHKLKLGGKGVGRLSWLVVFKNVIVKSTYKSEGKYKYREFVFNLNDEIKLIKNEEIHDENRKRVGTEIIFQNMDQRFEKSFPNTAEKLGRKILYHCLNYLIEKTFEIVVKDGVNEYKCKDEYNKNLSELTRQNEFELKDNTFEITYIPLPSSEINKHEIVFTADKREVKRKAINSQLYASPFDINGELKNIIIYVKGDYLNSIVTEDRTDFMFPDKDNSLYISESEIINAVTEKITEIYDKEISKIIEENEGRVDEFLTENPFYRNLFDDSDSKDKILKEMNSKTSHDELENKFEEIARSKRKVIKSSIKNLELKGEYQEKLEKVLVDIDKLNQLELAKYVTHRRIIIELLEKILCKKDEDSNYHYEADLHNLVFPMRETGEKINYDEHNLWLLDDRLAYYKFLASDIPFTKIKETKNTERMDIAIFNNPIAFSDKEIEDSHSNVIIVEFKRPGREDLKRITLEEQVYKYIDELEESKIKTTSGQRIEVSKNSIFNVYIVCEITDELKKELKKGDYKLMLDEQGYYKYNESYRAFIQIISLNKILKDAKLRNKIFFKKLGIF